MTTTKAEEARATMSPHLSEREREILLFSIKGMRTKEMAKALHLSEYTVKTHLARLYRRLGVSSRAEAVAVALASGLASTGQVNVPNKVQAYVLQTKTLISDESVARRVVLSDPTIPITQALRVVKALRRLGLLRNRVA